MPPSPNVDDGWVALRRGSPDPQAPNPHFPAIRIAITILTNLLLIVTLLVALPRPLLKYAVAGPKLRWMTLSTYLQSQIVYYSGVIVDSAQLPPAPGRSDAEDPQVPSNLPLKWAKRGRAGVSCDIVPMPVPTADMRRGVGNVKGVEGLKRWGFLLTPEQSAGQGNEAASQDERVILYFHGGSYVQGHPVQFPFPWQMAKALKMRVLGVRYRFCLSPSTAFPAPIIDALAGYLYLTQILQIDTHNIILMGDSSGAHLALCLSRYLADLALPQPGFIALTSPLGDCTRSLPSRSTFAGIDILAPKMDEKPLASALRHYTEEACTSPYFAPAKAGPEAWKYLAKADVRVYLMVGTNEVLGDDGRGIVAGMREAGVDVTYREDKEGVHCGPLAQFKGSDAWNIWVEDLNQLLPPRRTDMRG